MIYLDNAATTTPLPCALAAFLASAHGNPSSVHQAGHAARAELERSRKTVAECLGASPDEVYFTSGASESCAWAMETLNSSCKAVNRTDLEHHAVIASCRTATGKRPAGRAAMLANNETGEIFDVSPKKDELLFTDATAAAGHIPIDFHKLGADYMAIAAHKFGGIKGAGALIVRRGAPLVPLISAGSQERGKRGGTESVELINAMAAALKWQTQNLEQNTQHSVRLRDLLIERVLAEIPGTHLNGPWVKGSAQNRLPGNVNISFENIEGSALVLLLSQRGICVSAGSACNSGDFAPSRVLTAMGIPEQLAAGALRITLNHTNTTAECLETIAAIKECVAILRRHR